MIIPDQSVDEIMAILKDKLESDGHNFSESTASGSIKLSCDIKETVNEEFAS